MSAPSYEQMQNLFRAHTEAALKVIVEIMNGSGGKGDAVRLSAAKEILSRAWGKAPSREKAGQDKTAREKNRNKENGPPAVASDEAADADEAAPAKAPPSPSATPKPPAARVPGPWFRSNSAATMPATRPAASGG